MGLTKISKTCLATFFISVASASAGAQSAGPAYVGVETPQGPSFEIGVLLMTRGAGTGDFEFFDNTTNVEILTPNDLNWGWSPGVEAGVSGTFGGSNVGFKVGGFWLSSVDAASEQSFTALQLGYREGGGTIAVVNGVTGLAATGETMVYGTDANLLFQLSPDVAMFAGAAFIGLNDTLRVLIETGGGDVNSDWYARNMMIGPQIGGVVTLGNTEPGGMFAATEIRGGILFNRATLDIVDTGFAGNSFYAGGSNVLMLGGDFTAGYQLNETMAFTFGYQALWLRNVALSNEIAALGADDQFFMHGARMGLNLEF